jgi:hypothetical protein
MKTIQFYTTITFLFSAQNKRKYNLLQEHSLRLDYVVFPACKYNYVQYTLLAIIITPTILV